MGPVWAYWAFPTERYCGRLQPAIRSKRYPFANIDNYLISFAHLSQIKIIFGLERELSLRPDKSEFPKGYFQHCECMFLSFLQLDFSSLTRPCRSLLCFAPPSTAIFNSLSFPSQEDYGSSDHTSQHKHSQGHEDHGQEVIPALASQQMVQGSPARRW